MSREIYGFVYYFILSSLLLKHWIREYFGISLNTPLGHIYYLYNILFDEI